MTLLEHLEIAGKTRCVVFKTNKQTNKSNIFHYVGLSRQRRKLHSEQYRTLYLPDSHGTCYAFPDQEILYGCPLHLNWLSEQMTGWKVFFQVQLAEIGEMVRRKQYYYQLRITPLELITIPLNFQYETLCFLV